MADVRDPRPLEFVGSDGLVLRGESLGDENAPTVLLVHGGGQTRHAWGNTAAQLASKGWRAVTVDLRGHGDSDWHPEGDYRLSGFARDLRDIAQQLPVRPVVVGASLGGLSALVVEGEAAAPMLAGVVLVDITPRMSLDGVGRILSFMREKLADGFSSLEEAADAVARYQPHRARPRSIEGLSRNLRLGKDGRWRWHWDPRFVSGDHRPNADASTERLSDCARRLTVPALLVRGRMSDLVTPEAAREFLDLVPHAEFVDVGGAGHMIAGDRNDVFNDAVIGFLQRRFPAA